MCSQTSYDIWFLQITLRQKAKEYATILLEEMSSFEEVLQKITEKFPDSNDILLKYKIYCQKIAQSSKLRSKTFLTRHTIENIRKKRLSLQAPLALEYCGNPNLLSKKIIGLVGSRHPTYYGRIQAQKFARELSKLGYIVLSGGAIGVDAIANLYSLDSIHGGSISVIGNGLDNPYPTSNYRLFKKLISAENGLILSEFESSLPAHKWQFPQRNLTIAELCDFLLVVEATKTSGSLMTARFAKECGKEVGALPGNVDNPNTSGSHLLIQNGAHCIHTPEDIIRHL